MPETWAHIDELKQSMFRVARQHAWATEELRTRDLRERAAARARKNVERWYRELPAELVHLMCSESTGTMPADELLITVANDWLLEQGLGAYTRRPTRVPTANERALIVALKGCRFPPASFAKRFARELPENAVTDGQVAQVRRLVRKFRRQISPTALHEADRRLLSKPQKSNR